MCMVGSSNDHCINGFSHFIVHFTIIPIFLCIGEFVEYTFCVAPIYVTEGYDVFCILHMVDVGVSHSTYTNGSNVQSVTRRYVSVATT